MGVAPPANYPDPHPPPPTSHSGILGVQAMLCKDDAKSRLVDSESEGTIEDSLRGPRRSRATNYYRVYPRPLDIPKLDFGLSKGYGQLHTHRPTTLADIFFF
jgi:hypothetical protein